MATNLPIRDIPGDLGQPNADAMVAMDNGITMQKTTAQLLVEAGRPVASQAEAIAGVDNRKVMSPLATRLAIEAIGDARYASASDLDNKLEYNTNIDLGHIV